MSKNKLLNIPRPELIDIELKNVIALHAVNSN